MKVIIINDKIIDPQKDEILQSGFFIFKEAVRYCHRNGWKWYFAHGEDIFHSRQISPQLKHYLSPRMPEKFLFNRELHYQIYNTLVKNSSSYVPRPYTITKKIMFGLYKRGDGEFFGVWFVYHHSGVYFCVGDSKTRRIWEAETAPAITSHCR